VSIVETAVRFRYALLQVLPLLRLETSAPPRLYGFRDVDSLSPFLPSPAGETLKISGYFREGGAGNVIVIDLSDDATAYERVLFHEYVHLLLSLPDQSFPLWFEEGLSEFYAGARLSPTEAEVGLPDRHHLVFLSRGPLIALEDLLRAKVGSALFYAQSWALVHYLLASASRGQERLARFLALAGDGRDPVEAFREAFGQDTRALEEELRRYVAEGSFPRFRVTIAGSSFRGEPLLRRLSTAEVQKRWGDLFLATGRVLEARVSLEEALRLDPTLGEACESLGFLHLAMGETELARKRFSQAIGLGSPSAIGLTEYAKLLLREYSGGWVDAIPEPTAEEAISALRRSVSLRPGAREPIELLVFVYLVRGERLDEAEALLDQALAASPGEASLLYLEGQLLAKRGEYDRAREVLARVVAEAKEASLREAAAAFLSRLDGVERAPRKP